MAAVNGVHLHHMPEYVNKRSSGSYSRALKRLRLPAILMVIAILVITGFQVYWLKNNYDREKQNLDIKTNSSFRQTILKLQSSKLKLEKISMQMDSVSVKSTMNIKRPSIQFSRRKDVISVWSLLQEKMRDSLKKDTAHWLPSRMTIASGEINVRAANHNGRTIAISYDSSKGRHDTFERYRPNRFFFPPGGPPPGDEEIIEGGGGGRARGESDLVFKFLYNIDSATVKDSVTIKEISNAYSAKLKEDDINIQFSVSRLDSVNIDSPNAVTLGFLRPMTFVLSRESVFSYMLGKLKLPILFSLLLIGITIASFVLLYRNMIKQQRLAELKNDLISNISHELKTPIATVGVALEALKSFNAMHDPERTKEYLDISQNELQRLNLLVDKVLKLSIFEKKAIELRKERFDYKQLIAEIMNSMRLQFEKYHAKVSLHAEGDSFFIEADKLHITSVIYNLLDNALKYSQENPVIDVELHSKDQYTWLTVKDNGMGIPSEYKSKVFEKFFRVPTGDKHNIKGYGLGLSYVAEVVKQHHGTISVDSEPGQGSTFTVKLPAAETPVINL